MESNLCFHDKFMEDMKFYDPVRYNLLQMEREIINSQYPPPPN